MTMKPHLTPTAKSRRLTPKMTRCLLHLGVTHRNCGVALNRSYAAAAVHLQIRALVDCAGDDPRLWWATKLGMLIADRINNEAAGIPQKFPGECSAPSERLSSGSDEVSPDGPRGDEETR